MSFNDFNFKPYIRVALAELKFKNPTEVQQKLIPVVRSGRDLVGESKTGSGKTHTFLLPIFEKLDETSDNVQVVITAPSRELVTQIYQATKQIADKSETEIRVANYVGGTDKHRNEAIAKALKRRIRKFSRIEKAFYGSIILTAITMAISIIYLQSRNLQVQQQITDLNSQITEVQTNYDNAKQEVNELSSRDRVEQIAQNAGLTSQQDNIKQVE